MSVGLAAAVANGIVTAMRNGTAYTPPGIGFVKLHSADPGTAGTANLFGAFGLVAVTWTAVANGAMSNAGAITFLALPSVLATPYLSLWNTAGTTFVGSEDITVQATVPAGRAFVIPAGALTYSQLTAA